MIRTLHERNLRTLTASPRDTATRPIGPQGVLESLKFPGLWLEAHAVRDKNLTRPMTMLEAGLATPEHAAFKQRLTDAKG